MTYDHTHDRPERLPISFRGAPMDEAEFDTAVRRFLGAPPAKLTDTRLLEFAAVANFTHMYLVREMLRRGLAVKDLNKDGELVYPIVQPHTRGWEFQPPASVPAESAFDGEERMEAAIEAAQDAKLIFNEPEWPQA